MSFFNNEDDLERAARALRHELAGTAGHRRVGGRSLNRWFAYALTSMA